VGPRNLGTDHPGPVPAPERPGHPRRLTRGRYKPVPLPRYKLQSLYPVVADRPPSQYR